MKVSLLGYGVVGRGVWDLLSQSKDFEGVHVMNLPQFCDQDFMTSDINVIVADESETVVECIGGTGASYTFVKACLSAGKNVVTSNKALVAAYGLELDRIAKENGCAFLFSAACGGAIPFLENLYLANKTDSILWAGGILNGTTNFMLDSMATRGFSYSEALKEAQRLGYAEADPTADVSGMDTLRKILLCSMVVYGILPNSDVNREGIESVESSDMEVAKKNGLTLRLIGRVGKTENDKVYAFVQPMAFRDEELESHVKLNMNLARYEGVNCGPMTLGGQGAGRYPTASAILRDLTYILMGQREMISKQCIEEPADNECKECQGFYFVSLPCEKKEEFEKQVGLCCLLDEKNGRCFLKTDILSVKAMHAAAATIRESGARVFFAQYKENV